MTQMDLGLFRRCAREPKRFRSRFVLLLGQASFFFYYLSLYAGEVHLCAVFSSLVWVSLH